MKKIILCLWVLTLGWSTTGSSQEKPKKNLDSGIQEVSSNNFDFAEQAIDGTMRMPAGSFLQGRKAQRMKSMLKIRTNFKDKIMGPQEIVR